MDGNQSTPIPEKQVASPEAGVERLSADNLEAQVVPAAVESSQNGPKSDDGTAVAQAQVASVVADDGQGDDQATTVAPVAVAAPAVAEDVDVIEPEWVKRAEEAVAANKNDPRGEEAAVEALQIEYLKTRYNLDVKSGEEKP